MNYYKHGIFYLDFSYTDSNVYLYKYTKLLKIRAGIPPVHAQKNKEKQFVNNIGRFTFRLYMWNKSASRGFRKQIDSSTWNNVGVKCFQLYEKHRYTYNKYLNISITTITKIIK